MDIKSLYRQVILEHYSNPRNKLHPEDKIDYLKKRGYNPSCGDEIVMFLDIQDNKIKDIKQYCNGCSICCASTSILTEELSGLTKEEAIKKINEFLNLIKGKPYNTEILQGEVLALEGVKDFPARVNCASLSWLTTLDMLKGNDTNEKK